MGRKRLPKFQQLENFVPKVCRVPVVADRRQQNRRIPDTGFNEIFPQVPADDHNDGRNGDGSLSDIEGESDLMLEREELNVAEDYEDDDDIYMAPFADDSEGEDVEDYYRNNDADPGWVEDSLADKILHLSDPGLVTLASSIIGRDSQTDLRLRLLTVAATVKKEVEDIFEYAIRLFKDVRICSQCGEKLVDKSICCAPVGTFVQSPLVDQLTHFVNKNIDEILEVRKLLRDGKLPNHTLSSEFFKSCLEHDDHDLNISLVLSVDGVCPHGHSNQHLWPMTAMSVDLKLGHFSIATNLLLFGVYKGPCNPNTKVFNTIINEVMPVLERFKLNIRGRNVIFRVVTAVADQPAKRALFGLKSVNSAFSCFYCICGDTLHKCSAPSREVFRGIIQTPQDARYGLFGFIDGVFPVILRWILPWQVLLDIFHDLNEGFCVTVIKESFPKPRFKPKSDIFTCTKQLFDQFAQKIHLPTEYQNVQGVRNGTSKLDVSLEGKGRIMK
ncbi:unnamed protein product [Caenorhabditis angaria]|uniref:Transposase domain-containing protein n=1 Tax=Caenorhabditis angaria TaxID=860376 RepID=A0A9P1IMB7_9PELO|nr:unnamed protein product [Caenorhabditis angaria]